PMTAICALTVRQACTLYQERWSAYHAPIQNLNFVLIALLVSLMSPRVSIAVVVLIPIKLLSFRMMVFHSVLHAHLDPIHQQIAKNVILRLPVMTMVLARVVILVLLLVVQLVGPYLCFYFAAVFVVASSFASLFASSFLLLSSLLFYSLLY